MYGAEGFLVWRTHVGVCLRACFSVCEVPWGIYDPRIKIRAHSDLGSVCGGDGSVCVRRLGFTCRLQTMHVQLSDLYLASVYPSVQRILLHHTHPHTAQPLIKPKLPSLRSRNRTQPTAKHMAAALTDRFFHPISVATVHAAPLRELFFCPPRLVHRSGGEI